MTVGYEAPAAEDENTVDPAESAETIDAPVISVEPSVLTQ
jgi:hypothetical protein